MMNRKERINMKIRGAFTSEALTEKMVAEVTDGVVETVAAIAIDLNCCYCDMVAGNQSSTTVPWEQMSEDARNGMMNIVKKFIENPARSGKESHDRWMESRLSDGWKYGPVASAALKEHPNLVPWSELSVEEQFKDTIFQTCVLKAAMVLEKA